MNDVAQETGFADRKRMRRAFLRALRVGPAEYRQRFALPLSRSALARALAALGLSRKNSRPGPASRTART